jgi:ABC-2 type transport system permease protein
MIGALRYEWTRLRTLRSTWWLTVFALALNTLIAFLIARSVKPGQRLDAELVTSLLTAGAQFTPLAFPAVLMGVVGIVAFGHEYRHGTIRSTLVAIPRRGAVVAAKVAVLTLWSAFVAVLAIGIAYAVALLVVGSRWNPELLTAGGTERVLAGFVALVVLTTLLGLALAGLFRNVPAAIVVLLATPLVVEPLLVVLLQLDALEPVREAGRFLPFGAAQRMLALGTDGGFGDLVGSLTPLAGGVTFGAFVAGFMILTALLFKVRDA